MKKLLALFLMVAVLLAGCGKEAPPEETQPEGKPVFVHRSSALVTPEGSIRSDYYYNNEDILTQVAVTNRDNEILMRYYVTCDKNGNPIDWASEDLSYTCAYDDRGRIVKTMTLREDQLLSETTYTYQGDRLMSKVTAENGVQTRWENSYDEAERLLRQDVFVDDVQISYDLYTYDADGRILTQQTHTPDGTPGNTVSYNYFETTAEARTTTDPQGNVVQTESLTYDADGNLLTSMTYDAQGVLIHSESHVWQTVFVPEEQPRASI